MTHYPAGRIPPRTWEQIMQHIDHKGTGYSVRTFNRISYRRIGEGKGKHRKWVRAYVRCDRHEPEVSITPDNIAVIHVSPYGHHKNLCRLFGLAFQTVDGIEYVMTSKVRGRGVKWPGQAYHSRVGHVIVQPTMRYDILSDEFIDPVIQREYRQIGPNAAVWTSRLLSTMKQVKVYCKIGVAAQHAPTYPTTGDWRGEIVHRKWPRSNEAYKAVGQAVLDGDAVTVIEWAFATEPYYAHRLSAEGKHEALIELVRKALKRDTREIRIACGVLEPAKD